MTYEFDKSWWLQHGVRVQGHAGTTFTNSLLAGKPGFVGTFFLHHPQTCHCITYLKSVVCSLLILINLQCIGGSQSHTWSKMFCATNSPNRSKDIKSPSIQDEENQFILNLEMEPVGFLTFLFKNLPQWLFGSNWNWCQSTTQLIDWLFQL